MNKLFFLFTVSFYFTQAQPLQRDSIRTDSANTAEMLFFDADSMLSHARQHLNKPYYYGGVSPETGFDCSGFVCYNFKRYNVELPHSSSEQIKKGEKIERTGALPGDLIFFKGSDVNSVIAGHVGIIVSCSDIHIKFIHAAIKGGIRFDSTSSDYYRKRYLEIRRIAVPESTGN